MTGKTAIWPALVFASTAALTLAACESSGNYRVGWVGDNPPPSSSSSSGGSSSGGSSSSSGGSGSSSGGSSSSGGTPGASSGGGSGLAGNLIVTAGNTVIGVAGKHDQLAQVVNGKLPATGIVTGTVTRVLDTTGQTLVNLGEGSGTGGLILDGVGGKLGALVAIDLGKGKVIAAPEGSKPLIGLNVLAQNPGTGSLATVGAGTGGKLLALDANGTIGGLLGGTTGGLVGTTKGVVQTATGTVGDVLGANGQNGGLLGGLTPKKND
ncbi:hypothetical protein [Sphingomonas koreensis]